MGTREGGYKLMKIAILGCDGYIGYPLALHLLNKGHEVCGLDNQVRRSRVLSTGSQSMTPILSMKDRNAYLSKIPNFNDEIANIYMTDYQSLSSFIETHKPDAIVHLAEQPSAPWSMASPLRANLTQKDNVLGTLNLIWAMKKYCPEAHLVKLGSMGEYGTPNCDIPEGEIPNTCISGVDKVWAEIKCPMSGLLFPRTANSFYHLSKVHDTHNIHFACRTWGLRSTDVMQGVVFGLINSGDSRMTRFDYDEYFGTVINRFCAQAISDHPLTIYGSGEQTRGYLPLKDSLQCITLILEQPPKEGEYRTLNQFEHTYSINELADMVLDSANILDINATRMHMLNPRNELNIHYYKPSHQKLFNMGYRPTTNIQDEITTLLGMLLPYKDRVNKEVIMPKITWR